MSDFRRTRAVASLVALLFGALALEGAEIRFQPQADVQGPLVLLRDVAKVVDTDPVRVAKLEGIELFPAPSEGQSRIIRTIELRQLLRLHEVHPAEHHFSGATAVRISRGTRPATQKASTGEDGVPPIVVAVREIRAGDTIRATDVELASVENVSRSWQVAPSLEVVVGQEATRTIAAGQAIDLRILRKPRFVERGQTITIIARSPGIRITTSGRATQDGAHGDLITVESLENKEKFSALVTGWKQAEVLATGVTVSDPVRSAGPAPTKALENLQTPVSTRVSARPQLVPPAELSRP